MLISGDAADFSAGRYVPRGVEADLAGQVEMLGELLRWSIKGEASAHLCNSIALNLQLAEPRLRLVEI